MNIKDICTRIKSIFERRQKRSGNNCLENKLAEMLYVVGLMVGDELNNHKDDIDKKIDQELENIKKEINCHQSVLEDTVNIEEQIIEELSCIKKELADISAKLAKLENNMLKNKLKGC